MECCYGCHTCRAYFINMHKRGRLPDFRPEVLVFNGPEHQRIHKYLMRVYEIQSHVLFSFEFARAQGKLINNQHPLHIPLNPKPSGQCFSRRPMMGFTDSTCPNHYHGLPIQRFHALRLAQRHVAIANLRANVGVGLQVWFATCKRTLCQSVLRSGFSCI